MIPNKAVKVNVPPYKPPKMTSTNTIAVSTLVVNPFISMLFIKKMSRRPTSINEIS